MKCPECILAGKKSTVTADGALLKPLYIPTMWDEDGNEIRREKQTRESFYKCSNGHVWSEQKE